MTNTADDFLAAIQAALEIRGVRLRSQGTRLRFGRPFGPGYEVEIHSEYQAETHAEADWFSVLARYTIKGGVPEEENSNEKLSKDEVDFETSFEYEASFTCAGLQDLIAKDPKKVEEALMAISTSTGMLSIHPYARNLLTETSTRCGLPAITLPVLRATYEDDSAKSED